MKKNWASQTSSSPHSKPTTYHTQSTNSNLVDLSLVKNTSLTVKAESFKMYLECINITSMSFQQPFPN